MGSGNPALGEAIYGEALSLVRRTERPLDWAATQNNLGIALLRLGRRESGTARLEKSLVAFRAALEEYTRERVPLDWADSYGTQGFVLMRLAERTKDAVMAQKAFLQIEAALETLRAGGDTGRVNYFEALISDAQRIRDALKVP